MYLDLYKGLNLKPEDLSKYDSPLAGFDGRAVTLIGMVKLPVQTGDEVVKLEFIMVNAYCEMYSPLDRGFYIESPLI